MDLVVGFSRTRMQNDSICVIVYGFTKSAHFIPVKSTHLAEDYGRIYIDEILSPHGIPLSNISDRGAQFTSHCWRPFHKGLGIQVKLCTTLHSQTDGQAECTI